MREESWPVSVADSPPLSFGQHLGSYEGLYRVDPRTREEYRDGVTLRCGAPRDGTPLG